LDCLHGSLFQPRTPSPRAQANERRICRSSDYACSDVGIGYAPDAAVRRLYADVRAGELARDTVAALTKAMVLHPVAAGLAGLAGLLSLAPGFCAAFLAALTAALAFCAALAVLVVDFVNFAAVRRAVDDAAGDARLRSAYEVGAWTLLAATALLVPATVLLMLTCCSGRRERRGYFPKSSA
jgi:hypothetical protein